MIILLFGNHNENNFGPFGDLYSDYWRSNERKYEMCKSFICKDKVLQPDVEDAHELGDHKHQKGDDYTKPPLQPDGCDDQEDGHHDSQPPRS